MSDEIGAVLDQLVPTFEDEQSDWDDVLVRSAAPLRLSTQFKDKRRFRTGAVMLLMLVAVGGAVALAVTSPWRAGPTILGKASAAISPSQSQILYEKVVLRPSDLGNKPASPVIEFEAWIAGTAPYDYRVVSISRIAPAGLPAAGGPPYRRENGGSIGGRLAWIYDAATNTVTRLSLPRTASVPTKNTFDPSALVRAALAAGTGHVTGRLRLGGREVVRIAFTMKDAAGQTGTGTYLVAAGTYRPIRITFERTRRLYANLTPLFGGTHKFVIDFRTFKFLPATQANLALTDTRKQHPMARVIG